jgi:hypothetical protein
VLSKDLFLGLQELVCFLYGQKMKSVNEARWSMFHSKYIRENKITDLSVLPPCESVLKLHTMRANTIAYVWHNLANPIIQFNRRKRLDN